jgi:hypothetical protein
LAGKNGPDDIRVGAKGSVIAPLTTVSLKPLDGEQRDWLMKDLKGKGQLSNGTMASLGLK